MSHEYHTRANLNLTSHIPTCTNKLTSSPFECCRLNKSTNVRLMDFSNLLMFPMIFGFILRVAPNQPPRWSKFSFQSEVNIIVRFNLDSNPIKPVHAWPSIIVNKRFFLLSFEHVTPPSSLRYLLFKLQLLML